MIFIVCPRIFMPHFLTIFNVNTHPCERSAMKIDKRDNSQDIFIDTLSFFNRNYSRKQISQGDFLMGNVDFLSPFKSQSEYFAQFFNVIIGVCDTKFRRHHLFQLYIETWQARGGVSKEKFWDFFILLNGHSLIPKLFINIK